ncbi:MAG TPA: DUF1800 family protein, partial [Thermoanaerobaculia bacterium]|nr:DUF1800 family protein [Thermoanaerobaculia bacterium]
MRLHLVEDVVNQLRIRGIVLAVAASAAALSSPAAAQGTSARFYSVSPCRLIDTRNPAGAYGGPALAAGATRNFAAAGQCNLPPTASAASLNITVTGGTSAGYVSLYPQGAAFPGVSSINYAAGQTRANNAIVKLGGGAFTVLLGQASGVNHLIVDVNGYFDNPANNQPPAVSAGPPRSIALPSTASLVGTVTDDGKPGPGLTYQWSVVSGPGPVVFSSANAVSTTATFTVVGSYTIRLTASDSQLSGYGDTTVNVDVSTDVLRFLNQATFGPNDALINELSSKPIAQWIDEQIAMPSGGWPDMPLQPTTVPPTCTAACQRDNYSMYPLQTQFFKKALYSPDQLRQRMVWALHKILVISGRDITQPSWVTPYLQILDRNAFGSYRQILYDMTLNPAMGRYLDMVVSTKT